MVVRIADKRMYLWRAVDHEGEILDILVHRKSGSHQTPRWRKPDSNHRSRVTRPIFECRLGSIPRRPKKSARKRTGTRRGGRIPAGPMVRILLPPAASQQRTRFGHCQIEAFWSEYVGADRRQAALGAVIA